MMVVSVTAVTALFIGCVWRVLATAKDADDQGEAAPKRD